MLSKISLALAVLLSVSCSSHEFKGSAKAGATAPKSNEANPSEPTTTTTDGTIQKPAEAPVITSTSKDRCESGDGTKVLEQKISFPARKGCNFEAEGITRQNEVITAMKSSSIPLQLPVGEVCDMSLESDGEIAFRYDDILIFSLEQYVLFSSTETIKERFVPKNNYLEWDKAKLLDWRVNFDGKPLCIDADSTCNMPATDTPGKLSLVYPFKSIAPLINLYKGKTEVPLLLTATGDNDDQDCSHSQLDLVVKMKYLPQ